MEALNCTQVHVPSAREFFRNMDDTSFHLLIVGVICAIGICVLFVVQTVVILTMIPSYSRAGRLAWLAGVYPVTALASIVGACVPRAVAMVDVLILSYFARCIFSFIELIIDYFGGRLVMAESLKGTRLTIMPWLQCTKSCRLPTFTPTLKNLRRLELVVYQVAIIRPVLYFIDGVVWVDSLGVVGAKKTPSPYVTGFNILSTVSAMCAMTLFMRLSSPSLSGYQVRSLFRLMQVMVLLFNLQGNIFNMMSTSFGVIECTPTLPAITRSLYWGHLLLISECFLLSLIACWLFRPSANAVFEVLPTNSGSKQKLVSPDGLSPSEVKCDLSVGVSISNFAGANSGMNVSRPS